MVNNVFASTSQNLSGFAWGGTTSVDGAYQGTGWISFNNTSDGSPSNYGVNLPTSDGNITGSAWSEYYGWLSFDSSNLTGCPSGTCSARRVGNTLEGWARFTAVPNEGSNAGGWSGWVSLAGVTIVGNSLSGYAWSDELGWIDMSSVIYTAPPTVKIHFSFLDRVKLSLEKFTNSFTENRLIETAFAWGGR